MTKTTAGLFALVFGVFVLLMTSFSCALPTNISSCQTINSAGNYVLNNSISNNGVCLNITSDNVKVNGNGFSITGIINLSNLMNGTMAYSNLTIQNTFVNGNIYLTSILPKIDVLVKHSNGSASYYYAQNDNNQARGQALINALSNLSSGDSIYLEAENYDVSNSTIAPNGIQLGGPSDTIKNVNLYGAGTYLTNITGFQNGNFDPGIGSTVADLSIYSMNYQQFSSNFGNDTVRNVYWSGYIDVIYFRSSANSSYGAVTFYNDTLTSGFDTINTDDAIVDLFIFDSYLNPIINNSEGQNGFFPTMRGAVTNTRTLILVNTIINLSDHGGEYICANYKTLKGCAGIENDFGNGNVSIYGGSIYTKDVINGGAYDLNNDNGGGNISVNSSVSYNASNTLGPITSLGAIPYNGSYSYQGHPMPYPLETNFSLQNSSVNLNNSVHLDVGNSFLQINQTSFYNSYGSILFSYLKTNQNNFSSIMIISKNSAYVNSSAYPDYNVSANITLYSLPTNMTNPKILRDGGLCPSSACSNVTSLNAGNVTFSVLGFSNYTIIDSGFPQITVYSPLNQTYSVNNISINFTSSSPNGISSMWYFNGTSNASYTNQTSLSLADGNYNFTFYANDTFNNINSTSVSFSVSTSSSSGSSGGGGGGGGGGGNSNPISAVSLYSLKIITPAPISSSRNGIITEPIQITNNGQLRLNGLTFRTIVTKDGVSTNDVIANLDNYTISSLNSGQSKNLTLTLNVNSKTDSQYIIEIDANVTQPVYSDSAKISLATALNQDTSNKLQLAKNLISSNSECASLNEKYSMAIDLYNQGDFAGADKILNDTIISCRTLISQNTSGVLSNNENLLGYVAIGAILVAIAGFVLYVIRYRRTAKNISP